MAKIQKQHYLPNKMPFFTFGWVFPFSMPFLLSQTSLFAPNFRNQVRKPDFEVCIPLRLNTLQKTGKNQKTLLPDIFSWFDRILGMQRMISHSISNQSFWIHLTSVYISHQNWVAVSAREGLSIFMTKMTFTRLIFGCGT